MKEMPTYLHLSKYYRLVASGMVGSRRRLIRNHLPYVVFSHHKRTTHTRVLEDQVSALHNGLFPSKHTLRQESRGSEILSPGYLG